MMKFKNQMKEILRVEVESNIEDYQVNISDYENLLNSMKIRDYIERDINEEEVEKYIAMILIEIQELSLQLDDDDAFEVYKDDYDFESIDEFRDFVIYLDNKYYAE